MYRNEVREEIAAALERVAAKWGKSGATIDQALRYVAAELRAAETSPWPEQVAKEVPAPPPSLVERLRNWHSDIRHDNCTVCEAADALEAAQADTRRLDALERWACGETGALSGTVLLRVAWMEHDNLRSTADALAATMKDKP